MEEERFDAAVKWWKRRESSKINETPRGTWTVKAQTSSLCPATQGFWLGNEKVKSQVVSVD